MNKTPPHEVLIIFTRYPEPGLVKTRLIPLLGEAGAADLQRRMTEHVLAEAGQLARQRSIGLEVRYAGGDAGKMRQWLGPGLNCRPQAAGDLGSKMDNAFRDALAAGTKNVVLVGSDCPGLSAEILAAAFTALDQTDLVLGPARDGGYYLIGLKQGMPALFTDMPWSSGTVLAATMSRAAALGLRVFLLPELRDVDRPADLDGGEPFYPVMTVEK